MGGVLASAIRNYVEVDMTETRKEHEGTAVEAGSLATQRFAESGKLSGLDVPVERVDAVSYTHLTLPTILLV